METSSKDHARTSHLAGRCRVEEQAPVEQGSEVGTVTVVRDYELTGNAETHNVSSGPVKHDCSRGGTLRTRDCGQSRDVLHGRGRSARATDPLKNPIRGGTLGRWVNGPSSTGRHRCVHNRGGKWEGDVACRQRGYFSYTPERHIAFCSIFVHPFFPVFEPRVIFVRCHPLTFQNVRQSL